MEWAEQIRQTYPQKPDERYLYKLPMCRKIITEAGHLWSYHFYRNKIQWTYEGCVLLNDNQTRKPSSIGTINNKYTLTP